MRATVEQMKAIRPGMKATFKADHPKELQNVSQIASYTSLTYPELGVRFKRHMNRAKMEITIEAIPVEKLKSGKK